MLIEMNKLPPIRVASELQNNGRRKNFGNNKRNATATAAAAATPSNSRQQAQQVSARRKGTPAVVNDMNTSTLSTDTNTTCENDVSNPISMLLRLQQTNKQNEPIYTVVSEHGNGNRKEFTMEVSCNGLTGRGIGNSKKIAKREAAKSVLIQLGYIVDATSGTTHMVKTIATIAQAATAQEKGRKVTFTAPKVFNETSVQSAGGAAGRQLVPGMFLMKNPESSKSKLDN